MALVSDVHDKSGQGMFSKAGRYTSEIYMIFQKKNEILYDKRKFYKVQSINEMDTSSRKDYEQQAIDPFEEQALSEKTNKKHSQVQPFSKMISRDKAQKKTIEKNPPPPIGYYHPKYPTIESKALVAKEKDMRKIFENKSCPRVTRTTKNYSEIELNENLPDKQKKKVKGFIELSKQQSRSTRPQSKNNPHEERFNPLYITDNWSKYRRTFKNINLSRTLGRDDLKMYKNKEFAPDYEPKYGFGKVTQENAFLDFNRYISRKPFIKENPSQNENYFDYDVYLTSKKSQVFRKFLSPYSSVQTPDFSKMLTRERDKDSKLPSFMQKNVSSRMNMEQLHQKMLEMNKFMDGPFQTIHTSFKPKTAGKKKDEDEDSFLFE